MLYSAPETIRKLGVFQICLRMDFDSIVYVEYLGHNNYKNKVISFLEGCYVTGGHLDVHSLCVQVYVHTFHLHLITVTD